MTPLQKSPTGYGEAKEQLRAEADPIKQLCSPGQAGQVACSEHNCTFGLFQRARESPRLKRLSLDHRRILSEETRMKKLFLLLSTGALLTLLGCSGSSQKTISKSALSVVHASAPPTSTSPVAEPATPLPVPSVGSATQQTWRSENVTDHLGNAVALKGTSLDGKFD